MCAIWRQVIKRIKMFRPIIKTPRINMMKRKKSNISRNVTKKSQLFVSFFFSVDVLTDRWNKQKYISQ